MANNNNAARSHIVPKGGIKASNKGAAKDGANVTIDPATMALLEKNYGSRAAWVHDPNLGPLLIQLVRGGITDPTRQMDYLNSHLYNATTKKITSVDPATSWLGTHGSSVVAALSEKRSNPGNYMQAVNNVRDQSVIPELTRLGAKLNPNQIQTLAESIFTNGWAGSTNLIDKAIQGQISFASGANVDTAGNSLGGQIGKTQNDFATIAGNYGVALPSDPNQLQNFVKNAVGPGGDENAFLDYAKAQAKLSFPWMAASIDQGATVKGYLSQYTGNIAATLGISPDSINWTDPKWQSVVAAKAPDGSTVPQTVDQALQTVKTDPRFGYSKTPGAINEAYSNLDAIGQMFKKQG